MRNATIDITKGIGVICVLVGHVQWNNDVETIINSFHMPLFFIIAGYLAKVQNNSFISLAKKSFVRLDVPVLFTIAVTALLALTQSILTKDYRFLMRNLCLLLWLGTDKLHTSWGDVYMGPMWFMIALFWTRIIFQELAKICSQIKSNFDDIIIVGSSLIIALITLKLHPLLYPLPWTMVQGLLGLPFYAIGWYYHKHNVSKWISALCIIVWPFAIRFSTVNMWAGEFYNYPLAFIGACGGTCFIYLISKYLVKACDLLQCGFFSRFKDILTWFGLNSLVIICMHDFSVPKAILTPLTHLIGCMPTHSIEYIIVLSMSYCITKTPYLKTIYGIK